MLIKALRGTARGSGRASRRRRRRRPLRRGHRRRARRAAAPPTSLHRRRRHRRDEAARSTACARLSGGALAQVVADAARARSHFRPSPRRAAPTERRARRLLSELRGAHHGRAARHDGADVAARPPPSALFAKAGFAVVYPERLAELCCGQPFESKGLAEAADRKSAELEAALRAASDDGRWPIVFDTSPCAYRMKRYLAGAAAGARQHRVHRTTRAAARGARRRGAEPVAIHPVCSVRKMGTVDKLRAHRRALQRRGRRRRRRAVLRLRRRQGLQPAGAQRARAAPPRRRRCRRTAAPAIRPAAPARSGCRSRRGFPYQSIIYLVDACAQPRATGARKESTP